MTLWHQIRCDGCGQSDAIPTSTFSCIRERLKHYWIVNVKSKWTGEILDFCPQCTVKAREHNVDSKQAL